MTDLRTYPPVAGYVLRLSAGYAAEARAGGWTLTPAAGARDVREPTEIDVDIVDGPEPGSGSLEKVGQRQLRRSVESSEGGSSGTAVTLRYVEGLGSQSIRYQQVRYSDGASPRFELDELIRRAGLYVVKSEAAHSP
jgi:hypothetical protein